MASCRSCGAEIVWAVTYAGRRMPLDADSTGEGNVRTVLERVRPPDPMRSPDVLRAEVLGPLELSMLTDGERNDLRMPHHATCPDADQWRRS